MQQRLRIMRMSSTGFRHSPETIAKMRAVQSTNRSLCVHCSRATIFTEHRQRLCAPCYIRGMKAMVRRIAAERKPS